jgi:DNA-binding NarL/FixJ family response regulator
VRTKGLSTERAGRRIIQWSGVRLRNDREVHVEERCTPRIAVIEDSEDTRELWCHVLEADGTFEVCAAGVDGTAAVEIARQLQPDVMLLDLSMPGMGGLEALPLVLAESPLTRVVVLSGYAKRRFDEPTRSAGAAGFLEKHLPVDTLAVRLCDLLALPYRGTQVDRGELSGRG